MQPREAARDSWKRERHEPRRGDAGRSLRWLINAGRRRGGRRGQVWATEGLSPCSLPTGTLKDFRKQRCLDIRREPVFSRGSLLTASASL